jgi:hypothetical protein
LHSRSPLCAHFHPLNAPADAPASAPQDLALREELLDFRRRLLAKPEARKASAYRLVRDLLVALGDDERGQQSGNLFDAWVNEEGRDEGDMSPDGVGRKGPMPIGIAEPPETCVAEPPAPGSAASVL